MIQYYYSNGNDKFGPFNIEQLKNKNISKETLVWHEGISEWKKASELQELNNTLFSISLEKKSPVFNLQKTENNDIDETIRFEESKVPDNSLVTKPKMFQNVFSFNGRIRRTEYGLSLIGFYIGYFFALALASQYPIFGLTLVPLIWIVLAQGVKRCHDRGNSGWWILIPYYGFWLLFADSEAGLNEYGENPKGIS